MGHTLLCVLAAVAAVAAAWGPAVHRACVLAVLSPDEGSDEERAQVLLASTFADACKGVLPAVHDLRHLSCAALCAATPAERRVARALALHVVADTLGDRAYLRHRPPLHADEVLADAMLLWRRVAPHPHPRAALTVPARAGAVYTAFARTVAALLDRAAHCCTNTSSSSSSSSGVSAAAAERAARRFEALVRADVLSAQLHHGAGALVALHRAHGGLAELAPTLACVRAAGTHWLRALDAAAAATEPARAADAVVAATAAEVARLVASGACAGPAGARAPFPAAVAAAAVVLAAAAWGVVALVVVLRPC